MKFRFLQRPAALITALLAVTITTIGLYEEPSKPNKRSKTSVAALKEAEIQRKVERRAKGWAKPDSPDKYAEFQNYIRTGEGQSAPKYKPNFRIEAMRKAGLIDGYTTRAKNNRLAKGPNGDWVERGPANFSGRARGLIVDPDDATGNTWFVGSVGGGIWKTTNGGLSFTDLTPDFPNLATTVIAMAESDHDVIYAGTGEGFFNADAIEGNGLFKSTDRGASWTQLSSTADNADFRNVNRLVIDPADEDIVVVATNTGIFKSTNGGTNWSEVYSTSSRVQHLIANYNSFDTLFATVNGTGVIRSFDAGDSWSSTSGISGGRIEIAMSPLNTSKLYASVEGSSSQLYMSTNAGATWAPTTESSGTANWLGAQGWYDNTIVVDPFNDNIVYVGGINVWKINVSEDATIAPQYSADTVGTASFLSWVNFGLPFMGGGVGTGRDFFAATKAVTGLTAAADSQITIELRWGPGKGQKAHQFIFGTNFEYPYLGYVDVPFEAWDVTNNVQLMISFRDQDTSGTWDLEEWTQAFVPREYVFVHSIPYNSTTPNATVAQTGGEVFRCIFAMGPSLTTGAVWNPSSLPASTLTFAYSQVVTQFRTSQQVTNWYPGLAHPLGGTYPWIHADQHNLVSYFTNTTGDGEFHLLAANDGGIAHSTDNGATWLFNEETPDGLNTVQFYGVDKKPGASAYIGGTQDNGTWRSPVGATDTSRWLEQLGGDGFDCVWKGDDANQLIGTIYNNAIYKSTDGGVNWFSADNGVTDGPFITQVARSKQDNDLLFVVGSAGLYRSTDFADSWTLIPISGNWTYSSLINYVEISEATPSVVWFGTQMSGSGKVRVSTDGGSTFTVTNNYATATLGNLSGLATHPSDPNTAYALFSIAERPKVLRTTDLGQTWTDLSGFGANTTSSNGFPDVAVYCLMVMPDNTNEIWVGTDIGIIRSTNGGTSWAPANNGLPNVAIWEMKYIEDEIVVATHGRGIWTLPATMRTLPTVVLSPAMLTAGQNPATGSVVITAKVRSALDSMVVYFGESAVKRFGALSTGDTTFSIATSATGNTNVQLWGYSGGTLAKSATQVVNILTLSAPATTYNNNFNVSATEFSGNLFTRSAPAGFSNAGMHSPHPYSDNTTYTSQLTIPIIVQSGTSNMTFREIAIVEPGDSGAVFGDAEFWDYVIVEATTDGVNWIYLEDGYDCNKFSDWRTAYNNGSTINSALVKNHTINLLNKFTPGTVISVRFRLFADASVTAWGWMIDDLKINPDLVAPTLTLAALASPAVNAVRFAVGANEGLLTAGVTVNSSPLTMTRSGSAFFGTYNITSTGTLAVTATGTDSGSNAGTAINRNYTVTTLSKGVQFENYTFDANGSGFLMTAKTHASDIPEGWSVVGEPIDVVATGSDAEVHAEFVYTDLSTVLAEQTDFEEAKIGIYAKVGNQWQYVGGQGTNGKVGALLKGNQIAVLYNPDAETIPISFALERNFPNPFNPSTTIRYAVPADAKVVIKVYNMLGQEVKTLVNDSRGIGRYEVVWDGRNDRGIQVSSGVYLYRMQAGRFVKTQKMLFIK